MPITFCQQIPQERVIWEPSKMDFKSHFDLANGGIFAK